MTSGITLPQWFSASVKKVGAQKWVKSKKYFPRALYFETIDEFRARAKLMTEGQEPSHEFTAQYLAVIIANVGDLATHASRENVAVQDKEEWANMCQGAAWVVLQAYHADIASGKWS